MASASRLAATPPIELRNRRPGSRDRTVALGVVVLITTTDPGQREAAVRFIEHIMSPPIQKLIAEKYGFRPGTVVDVQGPVQKLKLLRLGIVRNPNPILVKAVLATVGKPTSP